MSAKLTAKSVRRSRSLGRRRFSQRNQTHIVAQKAKNPSMRACWAMWIWVGAQLMSAKTPSAQAGPAKRQVNPAAAKRRSEEHTSELQSQSNLVCRLLL